MLMDYFQKSGTFRIGSKSELAKMGLISLYRGITGNQSVQFDEETEVGRPLFYN